MGEAAKAIYEFIWSQFCDWYIELVKPRLYGKETPKSKYTAQYVLNYVLTNTLKLLHPFMPFITEEIWQHLPEKGKSIMVSKWPQTDSNLVDKDAEESMDLLMEVIRSIRNIRAEMNVPPGKKAEVIIMAKSKEAYAIVNTGQEYVARLANGEPINIYEGIGTKPSNVATAIVGDLEIYLPLEGLIDLEVEIKRLEKELSQTKKELERVTGKLSNEGFLTKAPQEVIAKEQAKQRELLVKEKALLERLKMFRG
jgi:valyl-tRNA synthetase